MKQTAVEWLVSELPTIDWTDPYWQAKLKEAKEMEKEQIMDAWLDGLQNWDSEKEFEDYYNETYGGNK